jgi:hypothetical protein
LARRLQERRLAITPEHPNMTTSPSKTSCVEISDTSLHQVIGGRGLIEPSDFAPDIRARICAAQKGLAEGWGDHARAMEGPLPVMSWASAQPGAPRFMKRAVRSAREEVRMERAQADHFRGQAASFCSTAP